MEKGHFPVVVTPEVPAEKSKKHVILTSWASVATALLLVVLIGGAFYVADLRGRQCNKSLAAFPKKDDGDTKAYGETYEEDGKPTKEDFYLDGASQTELIVKKSEDGNIEAIAEIDYKTKIAAVYIPSADMCVLAAGVEVDWLDEWNAADETTGQPEENLETANYAVTANKVTDLSILPDGMIPYCKGKGVYWMNTEIDNDTDKRVKRYKIKIKYRDGKLRKVKITLSDGTKIKIKY